MEEPPERATRRYCGQLEALARDAQYEARHREAVSEDCFLVTPAGDNPVRAFPNRVRPVSLRDAELITKSLRSAEPAARQGRRSEVIIRQTLNPQRCDAVTYVYSPFSTADSLPGEVPVVDHLCLRAREEPGWMAVVPGIQEARVHRCPDDTSLEVREITIGSTPGSVIASYTRQLQAVKNEIIDSFGFCRLAADIESVRIPLEAMDEFNRVYEPVAFKPLEPWSPTGDVLLVPVRFMLGTHRFAIHIRIPFGRKVVNGEVRHVISPAEFPPELQELFDTADVMVGVGVLEDLTKFGAFLTLITRQKLTFRPPIDLAVVARLAGYNLPRHGVAPLVWMFLGCHLPKGEASVGDGRWNVPYHELGNPLRCYLSGDIGQVFLTFYLVIIAWVQHIFPDAHVAINASLAYSAPDLLCWWVNRVVDELAIGMEECPAWTPAASRSDAISVLVKDEKWELFLCSMTPDWPAVTSGGCRYVHTARSWFISRLPALRAIDKVFWPELYTEDEPILRLGRFIPPGPSPRNPTTRFRLSEDPQFAQDILPVPATAITPTVFSDAIRPGRPKRAVLLEYAVLHPTHAADLLLEIEASKRLAEKYFKNRNKVAKHVHALRNTLKVLSAMPRRPEDWVDPYPPKDPAVRGQRYRETAESVAAAALQKGNRLLSRHKRLTEVLQEPTDEPGMAALVATQLDQVINIRGPGDPSNNDRVMMSMGSRDPVRRPRPDPAPAVRPRPSTSRYSSPTPSARSGPRAGDFYYTVPSDSDSTGSVLYTCAAGETAQGTPPGSALGPPPSPWGLVRTVENRLPERSALRGDSSVRRSPTPGPAEDQSEDKYEFTIPSGSVTTGSIVSPPPPSRRRSRRSFDSTPRSNPLCPGSRTYPPDGVCPFYEEYIFGKDAPVRYHRELRLSRASSSEWSDTPAQKRRRSRSRQRLRSSSRSWSPPTRQPRYASPPRASTPRPTSPPRRQQTPPRRHASPVGRQRSPVSRQQTPLQRRVSPVGRWIGTHHVSVPRRPPSPPRSRGQSSSRRRQPRTPRQRSPGQQRPSPLGHHQAVPSHRSPQGRQASTPASRSQQRSPSTPARRVQFTSPRKESSPAPASPPQQRQASLRERSATADSAASTPTQQGTSGKQPPAKKTGAKPKRPTRESSSSSSTSSSSSSSSASSTSSSDTPLTSKEREQLTKMMRRFLKEERKKAATAPAAKKKKRSTKSPKRNRDRD